MEGAGHVQKQPSDKTGRRMMWLLLSVSLSAKKSLPPRAEVEIERNCK